MRMHNDSACNGYNQIGKRRAHGDCKRRRGSFGVRAVKDSESSVAMDYLRS